MTTQISNPRLRKMVQSLCSPLAVLRSFFIGLAFVMAVSAAAFCLYAVVLSVAYPAMIEPSAFIAILLIEAAIAIGSALVGFALGALRDVFVASTYELIGDLISAAQKNIQAILDRIEADSRQLRSI